MWTSLSGFLSVVLIDLVLSGDNALVIGLACSRLPPRQRRTGILLGSLAAILLRAVLAAGAAVLLRIPLLQALGGLTLVWIAYKLATGGPGGHAGIDQGTTVWQAVRTIAAADLVMSLDNVLAVGGVSRGNLPLLLVGLGLTIPIIMWGSGLVAALTQRLPWLSTLGAAVLAWTAGGMIAEDPWLALRPSGPLPHSLLLPVAAVALTLLCALYERRRRQA